MGYGDKWDCDLIDSYENNQNYKDSLRRTIWGIRNFRNVPGTIKTLGI